MSIIAEYAVRPDGLALGEALAAVPVRLELERTVAPDADRVLAFVWAEGPDIDAFEAAMAEDPTVTERYALSEVAEGRRLYRFRVTDAAEVVLHSEWAALGAVRLAATYEDGWWHTRMQFPDRDALATYRGVLEDHGLEFRLERLYDADRAVGDESPLTDEQRETLTLGYERGFFEVPRETTATELADELGVSNQAVSERLRRGYARLVEDALNVE